MLAADVGPRAHPAMVCGFRQQIRNWGVLRHGKTDFDSDSDSDFDIVVFDAVCGIVALFDRGKRFSTDEASIA
jgi:hypothetical protein